MELTQIEQLCRKQIEKASLDDSLWPGYLSARNKVFNEVLPYITRNEPFLTDHSDKHIVNVLNNAFFLLGKECCVGTDSRRALDPTELYFLALSVLFHDVGNVFGRVGHQSRLKEAYEFSRGTSQDLLPERQLMSKIVEAHGGKTASGSTDTVGSLDSSSSFQGRRVDCQRIAAVLRLADELAEGPQRTSLFMQEYFAYPPESRVFHDYANVAQVRIGREDGRLALLLHIDIMPALWGKKHDSRRLRELLKFCYERIMKLDAERKYTRHYCSFLAPFKRTEVSINFFEKNEDLGLDLPKLILSDLVLPNDWTVATLTRGHPVYEINGLIRRLKEHSRKLVA